MQGKTKTHPQALPFLFLTEMWERFGFYVVQGMLVLYMTQGFHFSDNKSYTILGVFSALAYIAPMIGGLMADRLLGFKMAIIWGGVFLSIGYAFLALADSNTFYFALATIVVGNGLFKPNISSLLGALYAPGDTARDAGFTLFYIGINLGVLLAGLSSGFIKKHFGWHAGFALASVGLLIGLAIFFSGRAYFSETKLKSKVTREEISHWFLRKPLLIMYCVLTIPILGCLLESSFLGKWLLPTIGIFLIFFIFNFALRQSKPARQQLLTLNILIISSVIFWMLYLQMFFSINLFIDRIINKNVGNIYIPTTVFYTFESIFVILLGPFFAATWQSLHQKNLNPHPMIKFIWAIIFVSLAFMTLAISTFFTDSQHLVRPLWIIIAYFFITVGELLLSPIGLSAVTMLSPPQFTGMMMGIWFVALGFGGEFAGWLAKLSSIPETMTSPVLELPIYQRAFFMYSFLALGVSVLLFIVQQMVKSRLND